MSEKTAWLIFSVEHHQWWASNRQGYVPDWKKAGLYSFEDAMEILAESNRFAVEELMVPRSSLPRDNRCG